MHQKPHPKKHQFRKRKKKMIQKLDEQDPPFREKV
jgi:hypothetical protein